MKKNSYLPLFHLTSPGDRLIQDRRDAVPDGLTEKTFEEYLGLIGKGKDSLVVISIGVLSVMLTSLLSGSTSSMKVRLLMNVTTMVLHVSILSHSI